MVKKVEDADGFDAIKNILDALQVPHGLYGAYKNLKGSVFSDGLPDTYKDHDDRFLEVTEFMKLYTLHMVLREAIYFYARNKKDKYNTPSDLTKIIHICAFRLNNRLTAIESDSD